MSRITEKRGALGSWSVKFKPETPKTIRDGLEFFDHIIVTPTWVDPRTVKEAGVLAAAKYTGVLYVRDFEQTNTISGFGLAAWLGDSEDKANNFETDVTIQDTDDFQTAIEAAYPEPRPLAIGTIHSPTSTSGHKITIRFGMSPRQALDKVMSAFGTEYRINPDFTIDFGTQSELYPTTDAPKATIVRKGAGHDPNLDSVPIRDAELKEDRKGYATRSIVVAEGQGPATAVASHDLDPGTTFVDPQGNTLIKKKIVSSSSTDSGFAPTQAQLQLARAAKLRREYRLSVEDMELRGRYEVGDTVFLYDPDSRAVDTTNPRRFRGRVIYPVSIRLQGQQGPITKKNGVYHRKADGTIVDITEYVDFAKGSIELQVGAFERKLVDINEQVGPRLSSDPLVPNTPVFLSDSSLAYVDDNGELKARITISWETPTNEDGSAVVDGSHYSIRFRKNGDTAWDRRSVDWGENELEVNDLSVGLDYEFQIRGVDSANPPNRSDWSDTTTVTASQDTTPPDTPAAPEVAGRPNQVQITHELGLASGGTFNLPDDLAWLRVYAANSSGFVPGPGSYLGRIEANRTHLKQSIPVLGEFQITTRTELFYKVVAVDKSGNHSDPSAGSPVTSELWESVHIGSLTAGKITAGIITASIEMIAATFTGGLFRTAVTGPRVEIEGDPSTTDRVRFFTDETNETDPGAVHVGLWSPSDQRPALAAVSPDFGNGESSWILFGGSSTDPTPTFQVRLTDLNGFMQLEPGSFIARTGDSDSRRVSITSSQAALYYGAPSSAPRLAVFAGVASLDYRSGGRRIRVDSDKFRVLGSDNVAKLDVENDRIEAWQGVALNGWPLWIAGAGSVTRLEGDSSAALLEASSQVRVASVNSDTQLRVGGLSSTDADLVDNSGGTTAYRIFKADVEDQCDSALKELRGPAPDSLADVLDADFGLYVRRGRPDEPPVIGFAAEDAPEYVTSQSDLMTGRGKARRHMRGMKPNAGVAWLGKAMQEMHEQLDARLRALEEAK